MGVMRLETEKASGKRKKKITVHKVTKILIVEGLILSILFIWLSMKNLLNDRNEKKSNGVYSEQQDNSEASPTLTLEEEKVQKEDQEKEERIQYLNKADQLAIGYDYDGAIQYIKAYEKYSDYPEFVEAIETYKKKKEACEPFGAYSSAAEVNHVFFHSLIYDTEKAFQSYEANGYNYYMTTVSEFKEMMKQMYESGYVLVSIHDVVKKVTKEDGTTYYTEGDIMLPSDKKPFVLSQDDVNYYDYMDNDGFASRIVLDPNGRPSTELILEDGTRQVGDFDLIPVLETFIEEHPDFSYRGAKGIIALTGYEGALGYRTDPDSKDSSTYDQDRETVAEIAKVMRERGWEFASHSNGHRNMQECTQAFLEKDTKLWLENVGSLVGETDIYIYPYGIDIQSGIKTYSNEKYQYLKQSGFEIFCGVEAKPWMQIREGYVRMQRRPLDGQAMLMYPERLADLFDLSTIIDKTRPKLK